MIFQYARNLQVPNPPQIQNPAASGQAAPSNPSASGQASPSDNTINPSTGLPYSHVFGSEGTLMPVVVGSSKKTDLSKWIFLIVGGVLLYFIFKKKKYSK